jgi:sugar fermentation stimulation protein A
MLIKFWEGDLRKAVLRSRPHRFRINVTFDGKKHVGAHCVNPGRGEGLMRKGATVWLSPTSDKSRQLRWTWEIVKKGQSFVGTNSVTANKLIRELLLHRQIEGCTSARKIREEASCSKNCRLDFEVTFPNDRRHYIEVKNCHLRYPDGIAYFPDSKTQRSVKHLHVLRRMIRLGHRASLFIVVQRGDVDLLRPSDFHDPQFCAALRRAAAAGVSIRAFRFRPTIKGFFYTGEIPVDLAPYDLGKVERWSSRLAKHSGWNHWNSPKDISF